MAVPSELSDQARAECLGVIPAGGLSALADRHCLKLSSLREMRSRLCNVEFKRPHRVAGHGRSALMEHVELPCREYGVGGPDRADNRWMPSRKEAVIRAVRLGQISIQDAERDYNLSHEEFLSWVMAYEAAGLRGLRATKRPRRDPPEHALPRDLHRGGSAMPVAEPIVHDTLAECAVAAWRTGCFDTVTISDRLGVPEHEVCRAIAADQDAGHRAWVAVKAKARR